MTPFFYLYISSLSNVSSINCHDARLKHNAKLIKEMAKHNGRLIKEEEPQMQKAQEMARRDDGYIIKFINPEKITSPEHLKERLEKCLAWYNKKQS